MLFQQNDNGGNENKGEEGRIQLVVASKNSAEPFEFLEEALYQMALFVDMPIYWPWVLYIALWRGRISGIMSHNVIPYGLSSVRFISKDIAARYIHFIKQRDSMFGIMLITWAKQECQRIAQAVYYCMNLGVSNAFGHANRLVFSFFPHRSHADEPCRNQFAYFSSLVQVFIF